MSPAVSRRPPHPLTPPPTDAGFGPTEPFATRPLPRPTLAAGISAWWRQAWRLERLSTRPTPRAERLGRVREDFVAAVADIREPRVADLLIRVRRAPSLHDLWHLRPEVFFLVAQSFDQCEAEVRVEGLNRHFPTRAPRSGFAPLA